MKSKVYFTRIITPEKVLEMYEVLGKELIGKIAVKLHSGEEGNQNFLKPDFWRPIIDMLGKNSRPFFTKSSARARSVCDSAAASTPSRVRSDSISVSSCASRGVSV